MSASFSIRKKDIAGRMASRGTSRKKSRFTGDRKALRPTTPAILTPSAVFQLKKRSLFPCSAS